MGWDAWAALLGFTLVGVADVTWVGTFQGVMSEPRAWRLVLLTFGETALAEDEPESLILAQSERWRNA